MLAAQVAIASGGPRAPIVLVHGAANSAGVWRFWQAALAERGWSSWALDLRGHGASPGDLSRASMTDYADDVTTLTRELPRPPVLVGWSMGGLAALMAAAQGGVAAWIGLAPSPPAPRRDPAVPLREGTFGAEEYGIVDLDPDAQPSMPDLDADERRIALASLGRESRRARDERKAGVVLMPPPCPALVVASTADASFPPAGYDSLCVPAAIRIVEGASHWGLVLNRRMLVTLVPMVVDWLNAAPSAPAPPTR